LTPEQASSIPLALITSLFGLFHSFGCNLSLHESPENRNKTVLVWGGASSIGMAAVQLLAVLGYNVISTASGNNVNYVKRLGASHVYNYRNEGELAELKNMHFHYVFDTVGDDSVLEIVKKSALANPNERVHVSFITRGSPQGLDFPSNVVNHFVFAGVFYGNKELTDFVRDFFRIVQQLISNGKFEVPNLLLFHGVEKSKEALLKQKEGVSACKVVLKFE